jgi:hypothetical protein
VERSGYTDRLRRHRVANAFVGDHAGRTNDDVEAQTIVSWLDRERPQPLLFFREQDCGDLTGGATGPHGIDFGEPLVQLLQEIGEINKSPHLEETAFDPADEILNRALGKSSRLHRVGQDRLEFLPSPIPFTH